MKHLIFYMAFLFLLISCGEQVDTTASDGINTNDHRVFVTSEVYRGDFASSGSAVAIANSKCEDLRKKAGLDRSYVAIISTQGGIVAGVLESSATERIVLTGDVYKVTSSGDAELISESTDFWSADSKNHLGKIDLDEDGNVINQSVWSGTGADGSALTSTCQDWSSTSSTGWVGATANFGPKWIESEFESCGNSYAFYCISQ